MLDFAIIWKLSRIFLGRSRDERQIHFRGLRDGRLHVLLQQPDVHSHTQGRHVHDGNLRRPKWNSRCVTNLKSHLGCFTDVFFRSAGRTRSWPHEARRHDSRAVGIAGGNQARAGVHAHPRQNPQRHQRLDECQSCVVVDIRGWHFGSDDRRTNLLLEAILRSQTCRVIWLVTL